MNNRNLVHKSILLAGNFCCCKDLGKVIITDVCSSVKRQKTVNDISVDGVKDSYAVAQNTAV